MFELQERSLGDNVRVFLGADITVTAPVFTGTQPARSPLFFVCAFLVWFWLVSVGSSARSAAVVVLSRD